MAVKLLLLLGVLVLALGQQASGACNNSSRIDGCSIPFNLPIPFREEFRTACNRHDVCYGCGVGRNITRARCDSAFHGDMKAICRKRQRDQADCNNYANLYYIGVLIGGEERYKKSAYAYCTQSWVNACLP